MQVLWGHARSIGKSIPLKREDRFYISNFGTLQRMAWASTDCNFVLRDKIMNLKKIPMKNKDAFCLTIYYEDSFSSWSSHIWMLDSDILDHTVLLLWWHIGDGILFVCWGSTHKKKLMYIISLAVGLFDVGMTNSSFVIDWVSP